MGAGEQAGARESLPRPVFAAAGVDVAQDQGLPDAAWSQADDADPAANADGVPRPRASTARLSMGAERLAAHRRPQRGHETRSLYPLTGGQASNSAAPPAIQGATAPQTMGGAPPFDKLRAGSAVHTDVVLKAISASQDGGPITIPAGRSPSDPRSPGEGGSPGSALGLTHSGESNDSSANIGRSPDSSAAAEHTPGGAQTSREEIPAVSIGLRASRESPVTSSPLLATLPGASQASEQVGAPTAILGPPSSGPPVGQPGTPQASATPSAYAVHGAPQPDPFGVRAGATSPTPPGDGPSVVTSPVATGSSFNTDPSPAGVWPPPAGLPAAAGRAVPAETRGLSLSAAPTTRGVAIERELPAGPDDVARSESAPSVHSGQALSLPASGGRAEADRTLVSATATPSVDVSSAPSAQPPARLDGPHSPDADAARGSVPPYAPTETDQAGISDRTAFAPSTAGARQALPLRAPLQDEGGPSPAASRGGAPLAGSGQATAVGAPIADLAPAPATSSADNRETAPADSPSPPAVDAAIAKSTGEPTPGRATQLYAAATTGDARLDVTAPPQANSQPAAASRPPTAVLRLPTGVSALTAVTIAPQPVAPETQDAVPFAPPGATRADAADISRAEEIAHSLRAYAPELRAPTSSQAPPPAFADNVGAGLRHGPPADREIRPYQWTPASIEATPEASRPAVGAPLAGSGQATNSMTDEHAAPGSLPAQANAATTEAQPPSSAAAPPASHSQRMDGAAIASTGGGPDEDALRQAQGRVWPTEGQPSRAASPTPQGAGARSPSADAARPDAESQSSVQFSPTGKRDEPSAPGALAGSTDMGQPTQDHEPAALDQARLGETPAPKPEAQHSSQPKLQPEAQQPVQEAPPAGEIARPDLGPIASNIEGHAQREAAHLSSPPAPDAMQVIAQIARAARAQLDGSHSELTVRLEPPALGAVHMRVLSEGAALTAHMQVATEVSRELIQDNLPTLKQALADAGINVSQVSVGVDGGAQQHSAHGQALQAPWRLPQAALQPSVSEPDAAVIAALRPWPEHGGHRFDAFA